MTCRPVLFAHFGFIRSRVLTCPIPLFAHTILKLIGTRCDNIRRIYNKKSDNGGAQVSCKNPSQHRFVLSIFGRTYARWIRRQKPLGATSP